MKKLCKTKKSAVRGGIRACASAIALICLCSFVAGCAVKSLGLDDSLSGGTSSGGISESTPSGGSDLENDSGNEKTDGENEAGSGEITDSGENTGAGETPFAGDDSTNTSEGTADDGIIPRRAAFYADGQLIYTSDILGDEIIAKPAVPPRAGYEGKWVRISAQSKTTLRFEARYTPIVYEIDYKLNRGMVPAGQEVPATYTVETPSFEFFIPARTGYLFCGWFSEAEYLHQTSGVERGSTGNLRIYAKWSADPSAVKIVAVHGGELNGTSLKFTLSAGQSKLSLADKIDCGALCDFELEATGGKTIPAESLQNGVNTFTLRVFLKDDETAQSAVSDGNAAAETAEAFYTVEVYKQFKVTVTYMWNGKVLYTEKATAGRTYVVCDLSVLDAETLAELSMQYTEVELENAYWQDETGNHVGETLVPDGNVTLRLCIAETR